MSEHGTDEKGWPLVPVDPAAIPEGYELVRVGWPKVGEAVASLDKSVVPWKLNYAEGISPRLIIRPIPKPIRLPLEIVPEGWWITKDKDDSIFVYRYKPCIKDDCWLSTHGDHYCLPPWIAANLPTEWHDLPWDQSAMQQTEGGEG